MASKQKLTAAQERELGELFKHGTLYTSTPTTIKVWRKLHDMGYAMVDIYSHLHSTKSCILTDAGRELAASLFASEPVASVPQAESGVADTGAIVQLTKRSKARKVAERAKAGWNGTSYAEPYGVEIDTAEDRLGILNEVIRNTFTTKDGKAVTLLGWTLWYPWCYVRYEDGSVDELIYSEIVSTFGGGVKIYLNSVPKIEIVPENNPQPEPPPPPRTKTTRLRNPGGGNLPSGHGRGKKRTQSQKSATVKRFKAHKVSTIMMERNTPAALKLRDKWALQNKVNVPIPTITGAELLGLHVVEKPKRLTRYLERAA